MGGKSNSGEAGSQFSETGKLESPEICLKWAELVYKIYERMIHSSEVSFFISAPQIISSLGFILAACDSKEKCVLRKILECEDEKINMEFIIEHTLKFVHKWSGEFRNLVSPGQYHRARRVYAHPKFVNPHKENTFMFFRMFRVEEKIFEGPKDAQTWAALTLKIEFSHYQKVLNTWQWDQSTPVDRMRQKRMAEELSSKVRSDHKSRKGKEQKKTFPKKTLLPVISSNVETVISRKENNDEDKKSPILVWTSHAIIEVPDEFYDGKNIYTWNEREYLRIHESPAVPIRILRGKFSFNTLMLPTQNHQLLMLVFYGYETKLVSMEAMRLFVSNHFISKGPCIIRKHSDKELSEKKSIYLPNWKVKDFPANRIAQHVVASVNLHSLFVSGGFGDLAIADAVPSATGDPKKVSHFQHYGLLSFRNSPIEKSLKLPESGKLMRKSQKVDKQKDKSEKSSKVPINERNANEIEIIPYPICVVLWDRNRELPVYMGKVTGELTTEEVEEKEREERKKTQRNKWWFC